MKTIMRQIVAASHLPTWCTFLVFLLSITNPLSATLLQKPTSNPNPIQRENQLPGTKDWQLSNPAPEDDRTFRHPAIEGYAWTTSTEAGDEVRYSVSTTSPFFSANVYRMGWYQGKGGRLMLSIPNIQGHSYSLPSPEVSTGLIEATWPVAFTLKTNAHWVTGMYMVKLTASNGMQSYIPLVLRSALSSDFALIHSANTDEGYNLWGGNSLYRDYTGKTKEKRAVKVSFDRPFLQDTGAGAFFFWEYPMVRWLEQQGYDISYLSDPDLQNAPSLLQKYHALLIAGHSEYWSKQMRDDLETAINKGINLAVFAANTLYWQIRYESRGSGSQSLPERIIICYKTPDLDPLNKKENSQVTVEFRQKPVDKQEQILLGAMYAGYWGSDQAGFPWVIAKASSWVFVGTGLRNGDSLPGLVGYEYDNVDPNYPVPQGLEILAASPVVDISKNHAISNATLYTAASGARVFNAGTIEWSWGLDSSSSWKLIKGSNSHAVTPASFVNRAAQKITANILQNFLRTGSLSRDNAFNIQRVIPYLIVILSLLYLGYCYWVWRNTKPVYRNWRKPRAR